MKTRFVEATQDANGGWVNHGKFLLGQFDEDEWGRQTALPGLDGDLLRMCGWAPQHLVVLDLQTGEGSVFLPGGYAKADLEKHAVWVCPMFEPFLTWLWENWTGELDDVPSLVVLPDAPMEMYGHRRPGPGGGEVVHRCPPDGSGVTPCCGRTPLELPLDDRVTRSPDLVTCTAAAET